MASQSEDLAAETAVMRQFDRALQAAVALPDRATGRVLRYVAERVADELPKPAGFAPSADGHWSSGGAMVTGVAGYPGGSGGPTVGHLGGGSTAGSPAGVNP